MAQVTIRTEQHGGWEILSRSGNWGLDKDNGIRSVVDPRARLIKRTISELGITALLTISSTTAVPDPWHATQAHRAAFNKSATFHKPARRRITLHAALRLADEIMQRAEEGRLRAAEEETAKFLDLENLK